MSIFDEEIDYSQIKEVSLSEINPIEYSLSDVEASDNTSKDYTNIKDKVLPFRSGVPDYSKVKKIEVTAPAIIENQNAYDLNYVKNIGDVSKLEEAVTPVEVLMAAEPDFMPNMYNIYFVLVDNDKDITDIDMSNNIKPVTYDTGRNALVTPFAQRWSMIGARVDGIDVPQRKLTTATIKFAGNTINKVVGRYERTTKLELSIRLDQNMYVLDAFHALNADCWAAERKRKDFIENSAVKILEGKNLYNFLGVAMRPTKNKKAPMLDIVVEYDADYYSFTRYHDLMSTVGYDSLNTDMVAKTGLEKYNLKKDRVQRYVFHDCRFLGRSSTISFSNDAANPLTASFPFVYRKVGHLTADGELIPA